MSLPSSLAGWHAGPRPAPWRLPLARMLRLASLGLSRLARAIAAERRAAPATAAEAVLEFYAEAGAPEGALYVNGELVARLYGVTRL